MANLVIELKDDLARALEGVAAVRHKTTHQLVIEELTSLVEVGRDSSSGSPAGVLRACKNRRILVLMTWTS